VSKLSLLKPDRRTPGKCAAAESWKAACKHDGRLEYTHTYGDGSTERVMLCPWHHPDYVAVRKMAKRQGIVPPRYGTEQFQVLLAQWRVQHKRLARRQTTELDAARESVIQAAIAWYSDSVPFLSHASWTLAEAVRTLKLIQQSLDIQREEISND
jgi:hypothetical protein